MLIMTYKLGHVPLSVILFRVVLVNVMARYLNLLPAQFKNLKNESLISFARVNAALKEEQGTWEIF
jgi:hypothetical protein